MKNQKGFSLVELLVVVIIIAIIAAIAIPSLLASRRAANEASAISSLRTVNSAQATHFATTGLNANYAADLTVLAPLIDPVLGGSATPTKSGYDFAMIGAAGVYCGTATADVQGTTGVRSFAVSQAGVIYSYPGAIAATVCPAGGVAAFGAGTAIQ